MAPRFAFRDFARLGGASIDPALDRLCRLIQRQTCSSGGAHQCALHRCPIDHAGAGQSAEADVLQFSWSFRCPSGVLAIVANSSARAAEA